VTFRLHDRQRLCLSLNLDLKLSHSLSDSGVHSTLMRLARQCHSSYDRMALYKFDYYY